MEATVKAGSPAAIVAASWRDLTALRRLEQVCFPKDAWPLWDLVGILTFPNVVRLKAMLDGDMVGFIASDIRPPEGIAWIATIGVLPEQRKRGIGSALLEACEAQLEAGHKTRQIRLCVRKSNEGAIRLYERFGYREVSTWPAYYLDGEDGLVMEKQR